MFCSKCGNQVTDKDMACPSCGGFIDHEIATQIAAQTQTHQMADAQPEVEVEVETPVQATSVQPRPVFSDQQNPTQTRQSINWDTVNTITPQNNDTNVMSVGNWVITFLIIAIPFVGLVMPIYWAINDKNLVRRNYFRATFIIFGISIAVAIVFTLLIGMVGLL